MFIDKFSKKKKKKKKMFIDRYYRFESMTSYLR